MNKIDERAEILRRNLGLDAETQNVLSEIELNVTTGYTLADAIREGSTVSTQAYDWGNGESACALTAGLIAAKARGYV